MFILTIILLAAAYLIIGGFVFSLAETLWPCSNISIAAGFLWPVFAGVVTPLYIVMTLVELGVKAHEKLHRSRQRRNTVKASMKRR